MANVKFFRSTDTGAPTLYGNAGYMIPVLDACLVNGYGQQNISTMTHTGGTVTVTTSASHGLSTFSRQTIAGANETGYNGEFVILITSGTTFTYTATGITVNTATGTLTTKTASAGWTKPYNGTNLAVYRGGSGLQHYFRFDDTTTIASRMRGYVTMSAISTGTEPFPTDTQINGGCYWQKSASADATNAKAWSIWADDRTVHMFVWYGTQGSLDYNSMCMQSFGEYDPIKIGDSYASYVSASFAQSSYSQMLFGALNSNIGLILSSSYSLGMYSPRSYTGVGTSVVLGKIGDYSKSGQGNMGVGGSLPYPHPVDGGLYLCPVGIGEGGALAAQSVLRGTMRGIWNPLHVTPLAHYDTFDGNGLLAGKKFQAITFCSGTSSLGQCMIDISLTW